MHYYDQNILYRHAKRCFESSTTLSSGQKYFSYFYYLASVLISVQQALYGAALHRNDQDYLRWDIFFSITNRDQIYDAPFWICSSGLQFYGAYLHYIQFYVHDSVISSHLHDLVCLNRDQFFRENPNLKLNLKIRNLLYEPRKSIKKICHLIRILWHGKKVRFRHNMANYPTLPVKLRSRSVLFVQIFEILLSWSAIATMLTFAMNFLVFYTQAPQTFYSFVALLYDVLITTFYTVIFLESFTNIVCSLTLFSHISIYELKELKVLLARAEKIASSEA